MSRVDMGRVERVRARAARRARRRPLSKQAMVDVALHIVDAEGTEAVSMRRVAAEFDTGPASLYAHVRDKDELLRLVLDRVISQIQVPDAPDWKGVVGGWAHSVRDVFTAHSDVALLSFAIVPDSEAVIEVSERVLGAMIGAGVPAQVAAWALDTISLYVGADAYEGWLYSRRFGDEPTAAAYFAALRDRFEALPVARFPVLTAHVDALMSGGGEARFEFGLEMILAGIQAQIPAQTPAQTSAQIPGQATQEPR